MAEILLQYSGLTLGPDGTSYVARACGAEMTGGTWQGWLEFVPVEGGAALHSGRETTQPNRTDTVYWATGLTPVYLEGALERALRPRNGGSVFAPATRTDAALPPPPVEPVTVPDPTPGDSILNPFSVYRKGEPLLRRQLAALSVWHLVNIIRAHRLSEMSATELNALSSHELIELIVIGVRSRADEGVRRT